MSTHADDLTALAAGLAAALVDPAARAPFEARASTPGSLDVVLHERARPHEQAPQPLARECVDAREGIEALEEEQLRLVLVAEPGDGRLPQDRVAELELAEQRETIERLVEREVGGEQIGAERGEHRVADETTRAEQLEHRRREAGHDPLGGPEHEVGACVRQLPGLARTIDVPRAGHAHVRVDRRGQRGVAGLGARLRVTVDQQVLAPRLDARDAATEQLPGLDTHAARLAAREHSIVQHASQRVRGEMDRVAFGQGEVGYTPATMAIVKLVCQGCGANLDALDTSRIVTCGYCGTQNHIKPTVYQEPPRPMPPPPTTAPPVFQVQYDVRPIQKQVAATGSKVGLVIAIAAIVPMCIAGGVAFMAMRGASDFMVQRGEAGGRALVAESGPARQYRWESGRPFVADLDGEGSEDIVGIVQVMGQPELSIVAMSGADWRVLWETPIGDRSTMPEQPRLRFIDQQGQPLVLFAMGAAIRAFDGKTGQQKWVANLPDKSQVMLLDGDALWVRAIDESTHTVALASGAVTPAKDGPSKAAKPLRDDEGYDLIPDNDALDLANDVFAELRLEHAYCPPELLEVSLERKHWDPIPCTWKHGLAWASRSKGTAVPFLLGYAPDTKKELWRIQLTAPGSLETIDSGFNQPRGEFVDDDAIISFSPSDANGAVTLRRISMLDGATKWEHTLQRKMTENLDGMVVGKQRLYADHGGCMVVLDLATGAEIERLGGW